MRIINTVSNFIHEIIVTISPLAINLLELLGILIIIIGSIQALIRLVKVKFSFADSEFKVLLLEAFAAGLQFKLGAEIIKTVVVRDMNELLVVGVVVLLRVVLTFLVHWEIKQTSCEITKK